MRLQDHLQDDLRDAYGKSAQIACEQIAAIRTVASLRRENALHMEFVTSMDAPVRKAMLSTTKSTFVHHLCENSNYSIMHLVRVLLCSLMFRSFTRGT
jgi:ATP-binding cassette subfamily B (MDR/TAP) protein 1